MDNKDISIVSLLQQNAALPIADVAKAVNLSPTPCWRRVQRLWDDGVFKKQVVLCDPGKLKLDLTVFVTIRTSHHTDEWTRQFIEGASDINEIVEIYRMSGDVDYLLKIVVPNIAGYDAVYKKLIKMADLLDVSAAFTMETVKYTTALPLDHLS